MINKNYLKYLYKSLFSSVVVSGVIGLMALAVFPAILFREASIFSSLLSGTFTYTTCVTCTFFMMIGVAFILPMVIHSRYYSKNSSDIYLSLPINRKQAFFTENLFGLAVVVGSTLLGFLIGVSFTALASLSYSLVETFGQIFQSLPIMLLTVIISYMMSNLAVNISNSSIEAGCALISINMICLLLWGVIETFFFSWIDYSLQSQLISFSYAPGIALNMLASYAHRIWSDELGQTITGFDYRWYAEGIITILINLVIWGGLSVLAYHRFINLKSEHLGTAVMEKLGGPDAQAALYTMIFMEIGALMSTTALDSILRLFSFTTSMAFLGTTIGYWISMFYLRRKIAFRKDDLIRFAIAAGGGTTFGVILYQITK